MANTDRIDWQLAGKLLSQLQLGLDSAYILEHDGQVLFRERLELSGSVNAHGYLAYFNGLSDLEELRRWRDALARGLTSGSSAAVLKLLANPAYMDVAELDQEAGWIAVHVETRDAAWLRGSISALADWPSAYARLDFSFPLETALLHDELVDLDTIINILAERSQTCG